MNIKIGKTGLLSIERNGVFVDAKCAKKSGFCTHECVFFWEVKKHKKFNNEQEVTILSLCEQSIIISNVIDEVKEDILYKPDLTEEDPNDPFVGWD